MRILQEKTLAKYALERRPGRWKEPGSAPQSEPHAPTMISIDARDDDDIVREEEDKDDGLPSLSPLEYPPNLLSFSFEIPNVLIPLVKENVGRGGGALPPRLPGREGALLYVVVVLLREREYCLSSLTLICARVLTES